MKNTKTNMTIQHCILMDADQYEAILKQLFGEKLVVDYSCEGICVGYETEDGWVEEDRVYEMLEEYFELMTVTSVETADCGLGGIRIFYKV